MNTYKLEEKTQERITKIQAMTLPEFTVYRLKMEDANDDESAMLFSQIRRKEQIATAKLTSTSISRINEINFNITYEKYFEVKTK